LVAERQRIEERGLVLADHHLAEIGIGLAVLVLIILIDRVDGGLEMVLVEGASGKHLTVLEPEELSRVARPLHTPANYAHTDALGGGRFFLPARVRWQE
jgi:hypothetical protein